MAALFWLWATVLPVLAAEFQVRDHDRVVLLGNTLIEREQKYGYWETMLTARYPDFNMVFRNLGWSGDTVFGHARAGFGSVADGFCHLKEHVISLQPSVIILGYGLNESFEGEAGLPRFLDGLNVLLDALASTKARIVVLSPLRHADLGRPMPDPTPHNKNLRQYANALRTVSRKRGLVFVDLYDLLGNSDTMNSQAPLTDNGIHLTAFGYWNSTPAIAKGLGLLPPNWHIEVGKGKITAHGVHVDPQSISLPSFLAHDAQLPFPPAPQEKSKSAGVPGSDRVVLVKNLPAGRFALTVDGQIVAEGTSAEWAKGVVIARGPQFDQVERLRAAIIDKNRQYFYRWRPQNETYLFGFRKHEQGVNAREIPQFDPLVEKLENEIAKLRVPAVHRYELKVVEMGK